MFLGMDFGASDFGYFTALLNSLILDLQTIKSNGTTAYTTPQKSLVNDKAVLCNDAMTKTTASTTATTAQKSTLSDRYNTAAALKTDVDAMTPAGGDALPSGGFGDYRPGKVFCLPPALPPAAYLYPSPEAAAQMAIAHVALPMAKGAVTPVISVDEKGNITTNYKPGGASVTPVTTEPKIPTIAIIAAAVGGLYLMTR
jgi:hypothetical protein